MKKFIAFNGAANSGIQTKEKAVEWASTQMGQKHGLEKVFISEVIEVVERTVPSFKVTSFFAAFEGDVAKAA